MSESRHTSIPVQLTSQRRAKPDFSKLGFGQYFSDHVFVSHFNREKGWHNSAIKPYEALHLDPGASVLHYGQALFEGMKAFHSKSGKTCLFRPKFNWERMTRGAQRLCMEAPPWEIFSSGIEELVRVDQEWIPKGTGASLYIRPTLIGTEAFLGVRPANEYLFFVLLSPVGSYYAEGVAPIKIWVEKELCRAAPGGLGATKAAANYASSLKAAYEAKKKGYAQVLWLDTSKTQIEEVGTMNVFFVFKNKIVTPNLDGTILGGATRDSVIQILKSWNKPIEERKLPLEEVLAAHKAGDLVEAFGTGTAAVISPIGELSCDSFKITLNEGRIGPLAQQLYEEITGIQRGEKPDRWNWVQNL